MAFPRPPKFGERRMMERRQPETRFDAIGGFRQRAPPLPHPPPSIQIGTKSRILYIFNHENFENNFHTPRVGSQKDVEALCKTFEKLKCQVEVISDPTLAEVRMKIHEIKRRNFAPQSALIIVFLSHGGENEMIVAKDNRQYSLNKDVLQPLFQNETLKGKPKIIIAQACKGRWEADAAPTNPSPNEYIMCFSTTEGFNSYRNNMEGSPYIQILCEYMDRHATAKDFVSIIKEVNRKVDEVTSAIGLRQLPCFTYGLSHDYTFN